MLDEYLEKCALCRIKKRKFEARGSYRSFRIKKRNDFGLVRHWVERHSDRPEIVSMMHQLMPQVLAKNTELNKALDGEQ